MALRQVLLSPHLMDTIQQFQTGIYLDIKSLHNLGHPSHSDDHDDNDLPHLDNLAKQAIADWLGQHSVKRLSKLFRGCPNLTKIVVGYALQASDLAVLEFLLRRGYLWPYSAFLLHDAVANGQLQVLKYLLSQTKLCTLRARRDAAVAAEAAAKAYVDALSLAAGTPVAGQDQNILTALTTAVSMLTLLHVPCRCKVCEPPPQASRVVLHTPRLLKEIHSFQTVDERRLRFHHLCDPCAFASHDRPEVPLFLHSAVLEQHQPASPGCRSGVGPYLRSGMHLVAHAALTQWYQTFATPRLKWLRKGYPHMAAVVVVDAACFGPLDVLQYLHDHDWLRPFHQNSSLLGDVAAATIQPQPVRTFLHDHGYATPWRDRPPHGASFQQVLRCPHLSRYILAFQRGVRFAQSFHSLVTPDSLLAPDERQRLAKHPLSSAEHQVAVAETKRASIQRYLTLGHQYTAHRLFIQHGIPSNRNNDAFRTSIEAVLRVRDGDLVDVVVLEALTFGPEWLAQWLVQHHRLCIFPAHGIDIAAAANNMRVLRLLHGLDYTCCTTDAMDEAARNGHFEVATFLHFNRPEGATQRAVDLASANGHIDIVRFLLRYRPEGCSRYALTAARANGHTKICCLLVKSLAMFHDVPPLRVEVVFRQAIRLEGFWINVDAFQPGLPLDMVGLHRLRVLAKTCPPRDTARAACGLESATRRGAWRIHAEAKALLVAWLSQHGVGRLWKLLCVMPETLDLVLVAALSGGCLDVVQYMHEHGHLASFSGNAVAIATYHGQVTVEDFLNRCGYAAPQTLSKTIPTERSVCPCVLERWSTSATAFTFRDRRNTGPTTASQGTVKAPTQRRIIKASTKPRQGRVFAASK